MINVQQTMARLQRLSPEQLRQEAQVVKNDSMMLPLVLGEAARRKKMVIASQGQMGQQPTVVDQKLAQMDEGQAQAMPEDQGIAQLPTPNMETMAAAEGGIVGYADGGMVAFAKGGQPSTDAFERAFQTVLRLEGGATYVADDAGKGPTKYGINKTANPDVDVKNLTEAQAREIYRKRYWDKIGGDALAAKNPALATIAFDAAVNQGAGPANKMVAAAGGDPTKLLEMRKQRYDALVQAKPEEYGQFSKGWDTRLASLATAAIPIGSAQAAPEKTGLASVAPVSAEDARREAMFAKIPTGGKGYGSGPTPPAADADTRGFMARQADKLGISEDVQRNISNLATAAGGAMGAGYIPSYLPKVGGGLAALGERAYELVNPSKQMTAAQIEALRVANQGSRVAEAAKTAEMAGALPGEALTAAQAVEAANAAKLAALPSKAELVQDAAALRQAQEANQIAATGRAAQYTGQAAAGSAEVPPAAATEGGIPDLAAGSKEDFRRRELEDQAKAESPLQALAPATETAAAGEKPSWLTNDRALMMGLNLLAGSGKPGSGSAIRDLMGGLGTAGLATLAGEKTDALQKAQEKYYTGLGKKSEAEATSYASGNRMLPQALTAGNAAYDDWLKSLSPIQKLDLKPGQAEAKRQEFLQSAMAQFRIPAGAGSSSQLSTADQSLIAKYT